LIVGHPVAPNPWKPCDLRGVYPDSVSPELFRDIGNAIGSMLAPRSRVVVAGDFRLSTPELKGALSEGLLHAGVNVMDTGQGPTPLAYFAANHVNADAVLIVTASHNPASHNGLKLMLGSVPMTPVQLSQIRAGIGASRASSSRGLSEEMDPLPNYLQTMLRRWQCLNGCGRRVVLDAGNGAWSEIAPQIFRRLGFDVRCISCVVDGSFPDRSPDCSRASNLTRLRRTVAEQANALGIAWDGDGDRVAFVDEEGRFVPPDEIAILLANAVLEEQKKTGEAEYRIVVDVKCSDIVRRTIHQNGGTALLERTGHAFLRNRMVAAQALLGLDACGHYFFQELNGGDDGLFVALFILDLLHRSGQSLAELRHSLPPIFSIPELRIPTGLLPYGKAAEALTSAFPDATLMEIDGLRLVMEEGVVLVRESGTEPVLSLGIEGFDLANYERILSQCLLSLPEADALIRQELLEAKRH
jgi:phosphomannomutase / phosphoglucomutase